METTLTKAAHTPGPWVACYDADKRSDGFIREAAPYDDKGRKLAVARATATGRKQSEVEANARLIAAAPELLAVLEAIRELIDVPGQALVSDCKKAANLARATIAKATGAA